uniref:Uncharacterized protein n=1 Tax=Oryza nivara TaxID=4536 RepID=A0A0E0IV06_ORYNI
MKSSFCRRRTARPRWTRPRKRCLEEIVLRGADGAHRGLVEPLAEAHEHEEAEHGVPEHLQHARRRRRVRARVRELVDEHAANPGARGREEADARRVRRLDDEVAAEEAPHGAVAGARDGVPALAEQRVRDVRGAIGERGAAPHQGGVRDAAVGHEDGEAGAHAQRHDGAVPRDQSPQERLQVRRGGVRQPHEASEHGHGERARRDADAVLPLNGAMLREEGEEERDEEDDEEQEPLCCIDGHGDGVVSSLAFRKLIISSASSVVVKDGLASLPCGSSL